jgi:hypothetical protein
MAGTILPGTLPCTAVLSPCVHLRWPWPPATHFAALAGPIAHAQIITLLMEGTQVYIPMEWTQLYMRCPTSLTASLQCSLYCFTELAEP